MGSLFVFLCRGKCAVAVGERRVDAQGATIRSLFGVGMSDSPSKPTSAYHSSSAVIKIAFDTDLSDAPVMPGIPYEMRAKRRG